MPRLIDFQDPEEATHWRPINDDVMGGVSTGKMRGGEGAGVFTGKLSLDHGGGFASVRHEPEAFRLEIVGIEPLDDADQAAEGDARALAADPVATSDAPMNQGTPSSGRRLRLVYDGDCPMCRRYVRWQRIRREVGELELIDARQDSEARRELSARGIDLDQGFALQIGDRWYHGGDALHRLTLLSTRSGVFNRLMYHLFASPQRTARLYPWLKACRNGLLRMLGISPIDNLRRQK